jgi:hypothetical protein
MSEFAERPAPTRSRLSGRVERLRAAPALPLLVLGCVVLAALSLILPSPPGKDPWSWIIWGREVAHFDLDTMSGSSWKPLPVLFTTVFSLFGHDAAPGLWLVVVRAGALLAVVFAYRVAARYVGIVGGIVAGLGVALAAWPRYFAQGNVEPLSAALVLAAVDRHLNGHRHQTMVLGALAALGRPELWPFLGLYVLYVFFRRGTNKPVAIVLLLVVPALWLGGDYWGSGDAFHGSQRAAGTKDRAQKRQQRLADKARAEGKPPPPSSESSAVSHTVGGARHLLIFPVYLAALAGLGFALRRRERAPLVMAGAAAALFGVVAAMSLLGYGGSPRFLFPAIGLVCVLGGLGVGWLLKALGERSRAAALALGVVLLAASVPYALDRLDEFNTERKLVTLRADLQADLHTLIQRVGPARIRAVGEPNTPGEFAHQLAWETGVHLEQVGGGTPPAVVFTGPTGAFAANPLPTKGVSVTLLGSARIWRAYEVLPVRKARRSQGAASGAPIPPPEIARAPIRACGQRIQGGPLPRGPGDKVIGGVNLFNLPASWSEGQANEARDGRGYQPPPGLRAAPIKQIITVPAGATITFVVPRDERRWLSLLFDTSPPRGLERPESSITFQACPRDQGPRGYTEFNGGVYVDFDRAPRRGRCARLYVQRLGSGTRVVGYPFVRKPAACQAR